MHYLDGSGSVYTPTSMWSINRSTFKTTVQMRCFVSYRLKLVD